MQEVVIPWPGGEHAFRLGLAELETIQQKTDCGPEYLLHRINAGQWHVGDLIEVLRNGLIGGGMPHVDALKIVRKAFDNHPAILFKVPAQTVLAAFLFGPPHSPALLLGGLVESWPSGSTFWFAPRTGRATS